MRKPQNRSQNVEEEHVPFGYGFFFKPIQDYRKGELSRNEATVFEYLLAMSEYFLSKGHTSYTHSYETIHKNTMLSTGTIRKIVDVFEDYSFLSTSVINDGVRPITRIRMNYLKIASNMAYFYGGADAMHKPEQLNRIKNRKLALKRMHVEQTQVDAERRKILSSED